MVYLGAQEWRRGGETLWLDRGGNCRIFRRNARRRWQKALACRAAKFSDRLRPRRMFPHAKLGRRQQLRGTGAARRWIVTPKHPADPHDAYGPLRSGMCLDWLGRHAEAEKFFMPPSCATRTAIMWWPTSAGISCRPAIMPPRRQWFMRALKLAEWEHHGAKLPLRDLRTQAGGSSLRPPAAAPAVHTEKTVDNRRQRILLRQFKPRKSQIYEKIQSLWVLPVRRSVDLCLTAAAQPAKPGYATAVRVKGFASYSLGDDKWHPLVAGKYLPPGSSSAPARTAWWTWFWAKPSKCRRPNGRRNAFRKRLTRRFAA